MALPTLAALNAAIEKFYTNVAFYQDFINNPAAVQTTPDGRAVKNLALVLAELEGMGASLYDGPAIGITNTNDGDLFLVKGSGDIFAELYKNVKGVATSQGLTLPSTDVILALQAQALAAETKAEVAKTSATAANVVSAEAVTTAKEAEGKAEAAAVVAQNTKVDTASALSTAESAFTIANQKALPVDLTALTAKVDLLKTASEVGDAGLRTSIAAIDPSSLVTGLRPGVDNTAAFAALETGTYGVVDLNEQVYEVSKIPTGNYYIRGGFKIDYNGTDVIFPAAETFDYLTQQITDGRNSNEYLAGATAHEAGGELWVVPTQNEVTYDYPRLIKQSATAWTDQGALLDKIDGQGLKVTTASGLGRFQAFIIEDPSVANPLAYTLYWRRIASKQDYTVDVTTFNQSLSFEMTLPRGEDWDVRVGTEIILDQLVPATVGGLVVHDGTYTVLDYDHTTRTVTVNAIGVQTQTSIIAATGPVDTNVEIEATKWFSVVLAQGNAARTINSGYLAWDGNRLGYVFTFDDTVSRAILLRRVYDLTRGTPSLGSSSPLRNTRSQPKQVIIGQTGSDLAIITSSGDLSFNTQVTIERGGRNTFRFRFPAGKFLNSSVATAIDDKNDLIYFSLLEQEAHFLMWTKYSEFLTGKEVLNYWFLNKLPAGTDVPSMLVFEEELHIFYARDTTPVGEKRVFETRLAIGANGPIGAKLVNSPPSLPLSTPRVAGLGKYKDGVVYEVNSRRPSLEGALRELAYYLPSSGKEGGTILIEAGHKMTSQMFVKSANLGWITIQAEAKGVPIKVEYDSLTREYFIDESSEDQGTLGSYSKLPFMCIHDSSVSPRIDCRFEFDRLVSTDRGGYGIVPGKREGIIVDANSSAEFAPGAGINKAGGAGAYIINCSRLYANKANFDDNQRRNIWARFGCNVAFNEGSAVRAGWTGFQMQNSIGSCFGAVLTNCTHYALRGRGSSSILAFRADASGAGQHGVNANEGSQINFREGKAIDCGMAIVAPVSVSGTIVYKGYPIGDQSINATEGSYINGTRATITNGSLFLNNMIRSVSGSHIDLGQATVDNRGPGRDITIGRGGTVDITSINPVYDKPVGNPDRQIIRSDQTRLTFNSPVNEQTGAGLITDSETYKPGLVKGRGPDLEILSGVVLLTHTYHRVFVQGSRTSGGDDIPNSGDDLVTTILGGVPGDRFQMSATGLGNITIRNGSGQYDANNIRTKTRADIAVTEDNVALLEFINQGLSGGRVSTVRQIS